MGGGGGACVCACVCAGISFIANTVYILDGHVIIFRTFVNELFFYFYRILQGNFALDY